MILTKFRGMNLLGLADRLRGLDRRATKAALAPFDKAGWSEAMWREFWGDWRAQAIPERLRGAGGQMLSVIPASFFSTPDWAQFANELKGVQEVVRWDLYSYHAYPAAGLVNQLFFDTSEGTAVRGRLDTNMTNPGSLPGNEMMVVVGVGVNPEPAQADIFTVNAANGAGAQQWYNVLTLGWLEIRISGKEYLVVAPLTALPAGFGFGTVFSSATIAANSMNMAHLQSSTPDNRARFNMDPPLGILPTRPFDARLRWNALQAVTTAANIGVHFPGWKVRAVL